MKIKRNTICDAGWNQRRRNNFEQTGEESTLKLLQWYSVLVVIHVSCSAQTNFPIKGWIRFRNAQFFVVPSNVKQQYDAAGMVTSKLTTLLLQFKMLCIPPTWKVINEILEFGSWRVGEHGLHYTLGHTVKCESKLAEETDSFLKSRPIRCKNLTLMHMGEI